MHDMNFFFKKRNMVAKGISHDDFPENGVGRWSYNYTSEEPMYCLEGSPTHSPRRVVPYFYRHSVVYFQEQQDLF